MLNISPCSISRETGEEVNELRYHLKIFIFLGIKMCDDSDSDNIVAGVLIASSFWDQVFYTHNFFKLENFL